MQTHSESTGATQPPIGLFVRTGMQATQWLRSWSSATQAMTPQGQVTDHSMALPTVDVWHKYVVHISPGYLAGQNPKTEVWMSVGGGAYTQVVKSTGLNDYNWNTGTYPRIGFYKWAGTNWSASYPTIAAYFTTLYSGQGADRYNEAVASLAGL